jgi:hypothetical protein
MRLLFRTFVLSALAAGSLLVPVAAAHADDSPGTLTLHSEPGDVVGRGQDYSYTRPFDQVFPVGGFRGASTINADIEALNGDSWRLTFAAPTGQPIAPGEYTDAQRFPFQEAGRPGLSVDGNSIGCNTLTGSFTVLELEYGANNLVSRFHATFEQHCEGVAAALRGEIVLTQPPPLPPLAYTMRIHRLGTLSSDGVITVTGTLTCNQYVRTMVDVDVSQGDGSTSAGTFIEIPCHPDTTEHWTATFDTSPGDFHPGRTNDSGFAAGTDGFAGVVVTGNAGPGTVFLVPIR